MEITNIKRNANKSAKDLCFDIRFFEEEKSIVEEMVRKFNHLMAKIKNN